MTLEEKIEKAKEYLGDRWVLHSNYQFKKQHSYAHKQSFILQNYVRTTGAIETGRV